MTNSIELCGRSVGPGHPTFVIAEAGINHNGDLGLARDLVQAAKHANVDAVKFQTFTASGIMTETAGVAAHLEAGAGREDVYSFVKRVSLDGSAHEMLWRECEDVGISFLSSPFSIESVELLEDLGVAAYKGASGELDNLPLLACMAQTRKPIILSTGMGTLAEVDRALETIAANGGSQVVLLHCTSNYPTNPSDANLRAIETLAHAFDVPVGYSDHTIGNVIPLAAVARGADVIEKHFTLDRSMPGPDQAVSGEPKDFEELVSGIRMVEAALGDGHKRPVSNETDMRAAMRRSIVAATDIPQGSVIEHEMLAFKRPGSGISPAEMEWVLGRKTTKGIAADTVIERDHLV